MRRTTAATRRSPPRVLLAWLLAAAPLLGGCAGDDPHTPVRPADLARLAAEGEQGLRALGRGRFEVLSFSPGAGKRLDYCDTFHFRTRLFALGFSARVRFVAAVDVPSTSALDASLGAPGSSVEQVEEQLTLHEVLGEGRREAGSEAALDAAAVFLDLEPGLRFERIDRVR
ncbi:MAG: hypothetical protein U0359_22585 [Byssovorax sp.]